jgi:hypothetical protein
MISPSQRPLPDNTQHSQQTNIHAPGGIRNHDRSMRAAVDRAATGTGSTMVIRNFNLGRSLVRKMWNTRFNQYTIIFVKDNYNLQCLSSFANGCLSCLYLASSKTQIFHFFCCYTSHIIFKKIFLFFIHPSTTQDTEKNTEGAFAPPPPAQSKLRLWILLVGVLPALCSMYF